jgi:hypothetical protein
MLVLLGLLLAAVVSVGVVGVAGLLYYYRVLRPKLLEAAAVAPAPSVEADPLSVVVAQLQELAVLRDKGILTTKEFASKKTQLLERI